MSTPSTGNQLDEKCDQILQCAVCLERYTDPRMLPCVHSFCMSCINRLPQQDDTTVSCPVCKKPSQLGKKGASSLPAAFHMNMLLEIDDLLKKNSLQVCSSHGQRKKFLYCKRCHEDICFECYNESHIDHKSECDQIDVLVTEHKKEIEVLLQQLEKLKEDVEEAKPHFETAEKQMEEQEKLALERITEAYRQLENRLKESRKKLSEKAAATLQKKLKLNSLQRRYVDEQLEFIQQCQCLIKERVVYGANYKQVQVVKDRLVEWMTNTRSSMLQPAQDEKMAFNADPNALAACAHIGSISSKLFYGFPGLISVDDPPCMLLGRPVKVLLTAATTLPANSVSCQLTQSGNAKECPVTDLGGGRYKVTIHPTDGGDHHLKVLINGDESCSTPVHVDAWSSKKLEVFAKDLKWPHGVAVTEDGEQIVITENKEKDPDPNCKKRVTVISSSTGKPLASGGGNILTSPWGVAIINDKILVADKYGPLQRFDFNCSCISTSKFEYAYWIVQHPNGKIYATTRNEDYFFVELDEELNGHKTPVDLSVFKRACGVAFDSEGNHYITDSRQQEVYKFRPNGERLAFTHQEQNFEWITGICIDSNDIVYIADKDMKKILIFNTEGKMLGEIGCSDNPNFCPHGLAVDKKGNLYVCDNNSDKVYVLRS